MTIASCYADDETAEPSTVTVSGKHALEQLRDAIDYALRGKP